jgi:hypothetical protein
VAAIIGASAVAAFVLTRPSETLVVAERTPMPMIDEDNVDEINAAIAEKVKKGTFETHFTTTWQFPDGKSASSDAVMGNSANNTYPFWFELTLDDTKETVYTSGLLPVGTALKEIVLTKDLDAGTYPATLYVHLVDDANNNEPIESNMGFNITLIIKN